MAAGLSTRGSERGAEAPRSGALVVVADLSLGYEESSHAARVIEEVDLVLEPGERVALVGASGNGKTTLLNALAGLVRPIAGTVNVDGTTVASVAGRCTSRHAAYMLQSDLLLPWKTVRDNAALAALVARPKVSWRGRGAAKARACEHAGSLLREFGLSEVLDAYPHQLSGGMRRRVALARTLGLGRGLVLLDEPFAGLDDATRGELRSWLQGVMAGHAATWVVVTHDREEAETLADRVVTLEGRPARLR